MFTSYVYSIKDYDWLEKYRCFGNNYLINSDNSTVLNNQFNGSGIYENEFVSSKECLQNKCQIELSDSEIDDIQFEMRGSLTNYIVNRKSEKIYIVPDPLGLSIVYYYLSPSLKVYSNSMKEIKKILDLFGYTLTKDINYFYEALVIGNGGIAHTPYEEIHALQPFSYIKIGDNFIQNVENKRIINFIDSIENIDYKDVIKEAKKDIILNINAASNYKTKGKKITQLTGGFDSRLILSALLNQEKEQEFYYFCSGPDGTKDKDIAKELCREYGLTYTDYSGYEITKPVENRIDSFLWSLDYTSGTSYEAHGNYKNQDNLVISGGLGGLYRSVYGLGADSVEFDSYKSLIKKQWPELDIEQNRSIFKGEFIKKFEKDFLNINRKFQV